MINNFNFKKKFGQNFITDKNLLNAIISDAKVNKDSQVLEIGAGAGTLTEVLANSVDKVLAYEIDKELSPYLMLLEEKYKNVKIIFDDFLKSNQVQINEYFDKKIDVVANLPYYITTPIIFKLIDEKFNINSLTLMVQKEVAERLVADNSTKDYGAISVILQSQADLKLTRVVPKTLFTPQPNVDSAIVHIDINNNKFNIQNKELFSKVVKVSFNYRRKTLVNCLQLGFGFSKNICEKIINEIGLNNNIRGEKLTISQFVDLTNLIEKYLQNI